MVLRRSVVQGLSMLQQPGVDMCCQGVDAPTQVRKCTFLAQWLSWLGA